MIVDIKIFQAVLRMPAVLKQEILHYAEYLLDQYTKAESSQKTLGQAHGYGSWAGQIAMSDDFDRPLEDLEEYM